MRTFVHYLKVFVRSVLFMGAIVGFVFGLDEIVSLLFGTGGHLGYLVAWYFVSAACTTVLLLWHNWDTYPQRIRAAGVEEALERDIDYQLRNIR